MHYRFIVLEGIDGCGKTTQVRLLAGAMRWQGKPVRCFREPGGTALGEKIRRILLAHRNQSMTRQAELFLYMASRAQLVREKISVARRKSHVLCDRYFYSSVAYQGAGNRREAKFIWKVSQWAIQDCAPDLVLILDVSPRVALARLRRAKDRVESQGLGYYKKVRRTFRALANAHPQYIKLVDASRNAEEVHREICRRVYAIL